MKKIILLPILFVSIFLHSQEATTKYITKQDVIALIDKLAKEGSVTEKAIVVLDEKFVIVPQDIHPEQRFMGEPRVENKGNQDLTKIYGVQAINGVIFIKSIPLLADNKTVQPVGKILFMLGDKRITKEEAMDIDPETIESIDIIKSQDEIAHYTTENIESVVIIKLKNE